MIQPIAFINRELARWLPLLPAAEVKTLLALMLQANVAGFARTSVEGVAARVGVGPEQARELLSQLHRRRIIFVEEQGQTLLVTVRGFLGGRGAPRDAVVPTCGYGG